MKLRIYVSGVFVTCILISFYGYFFVYKTDLVEEENLISLKQGELSQKEFSKEMNWQNEYLKIENNSYTGEGIKIAVLDTNVQNQTCDFHYIIHKYPNNGADLHGDHIVATLKSIAPNATLYCTDIASPNGRINKSNFVDGFKWALAQDVDIINMSLGFRQEIEEITPLLNKAYQKEIILIAAAGNDGENHLDYPASSPYVISVGAIDAKGERWTYSNYGSNLDFVLPGVSIRIQNNSIEGTSYSTALLSGMVARIKEEYPDIHSPMLYNQLKSMSSNKMKIDTFTGYGTPVFD